MNSAAIVDSPVYICSVEQREYHGDRHRADGNTPCKFCELQATNKSQLIEEALRYARLFYEFESEVRDLEQDLRRRIRQDRAVQVMDMLPA